MLEKPDIPEQLIINRTQAEYRLEIVNATFLPLGYDMNTAIYSVNSWEGITYFLKLRRSNFDPIAVVIPHFLRRQGIRGIISPLETRIGELFGNLHDRGVNYAMILYPFISGKDGYQMKLEDRHWIELGRTLQMIHATQVPTEIARKVTSETYNPQWRESVKQFQALVEEATFPDPVAEKLSAFIRTKREDISFLVRRAEELARTVSRQPSDFVLCHSDAHPGNFLITDGGEIYLVDWDNPILAPRERDLMFFGAGMSGDQPGGRQETLFYQGYGQGDVDRKTLAYYRYERIIQDIAEFCKQLLLTTSGGEDREQAYQYFTSSFEPGGVLEAAINTDLLISHQV